MSDPSLRVFYGPPGTGKTWKAKREAVRIIDGSVDEATVDARHAELIGQNRIWWVTFHPSYSYEDFVEGYRPVAVGGGIEYRVQDGPFKLACRSARGNDPYDAIHAMNPGMALSEGTGAYLVESSNDEVVLVRRQGDNGPEARRPIAWATIDSIVVAIRDGRLTLDDLKYPKGSGVASEAKRKVSEAVDIAVHYLSDEVPIRALVKYVLTRDIRPGEMLKDATDKERYEVAIVDQGGWLLRSSPNREDQVADVLERYVPRLLIDRFIALGVTPAVFSIAGKSTYDPKDLGIPESELPEPEDGEEKGSRKGPTLRKWVGAQAGLSSTELANIGHVGAIYRRVTGQHESERMRPVVLVIDEINRADLSRVFGELITLIELDKREGASEEGNVLLPYSRTKISVPGTLSVLATMNTADRSLAVFDIALRRRFDFVELPPEASLCPASYGGVDVANALTRWNSRLEQLLSKDLAIGHSELMEGRLEARRGASDWPSGVDGEIRSVAATLRRKIVPLLLEYFHDDWQKAELVLGKRGLLQEMDAADLGELAEGLLDVEGNPSFRLPEWWNPDSVSFDADRLKNALIEA